MVNYNECWCSCIHADQSLYFKDTKASPESDVDPEDDNQICRMGKSVVQELVGSGSASAVDCIGLSTLVVFS